MEKELKYESKIFYKPYKITYIKFTSEFDYNIKKELFNKQINELEDALKEKESSIEQSYNYQIINDQINFLYKELYKKDNGFQLHCYIFIGEVTDEIKEILENINKKKLPYLSVDDTTKLEDYFKQKYGYNFFDEINIDWSKYDNVKFIYTLILEDDSIYSLKKTIFSELSSYIDNEYLLPDNLFLTTFLDNNYMNLLEDTSESTISPFNIIIQNMFCKMLKNSNNPSIQIFIEELKSIGIDQHNIDILVKIYTSEKELTYINICNDKFIYKHITKFLRNPIITHTYYNNLYKTEIYLDNLIYKYFDSNYVGYKLQLNKEENIITSVNEDKINRLISSIGRIYNKEIYFYSFSNIHSVIEEKKVFDLKLEKQLNEYFNGFISKYFPNINKNNYIKLLNSLKLDSDTKKDFDSINNIFRNKNKLFSLITSNDTFNIPEININKINNIYTKIKHKLNLHKNINLLDIFNKIELSLDIPFVKFKDPFTKEIMYKIFKEITKIYSNNDIPYISKEILIDWIKVSSYELDNNEIKKIKALPKSIEYKIKLGNFKNSNNTYNGKIKKINYDHDKIISLDILNLDNNILIKNVNLNFIINLKHEDIIIDNEVNFYKFDTLYGNLEITKNGELFLSVLWKEFYEISLEKIDNILNNKLNFFIDEIKSLEYDENYKHIILNSNTSILNLNNSFYNTSYLYQNCVMTIDIPQNIVLNYDNIKNLGDIYFTHVSLNSNIYENNEKVDYFDKTWKNLNNYVYRINKFLSDGNYDIIQTDKFGNYIGIIENVHTKYIRKQGDINYRKYIHFKYRRVDNYSEIPITKQYIHKLYKQNIKKEEILQKIITKFEFVDLATAQKLINEEINQIIDKKKKNNFGIDIKIHYITPIKIKEINQYKIYIEGFSNILELNNIKNFINCFFNTYTLFYKQNIEKYEEKYKNFSELYNDFFKLIQNKNNSEINALIDDNRKIEQKAHKEVTEDIDIFNLYDIDHDYEPDDDDDDDDDDNDEDENDDIEQNNDEKEDSQKPIDKLLSQENYSDIKNPILRRLYNRDINLFTWDSDPKYARRCQSSRQPIVISDDEKKKIELDPDAFKRSPNSISCSKQDLLENPKKDCNAIKWGSSPDNQNWYICPQIFDFEDNVTVNFRNIEYEGLGTLDKDKEAAQEKYGTEYGKKVFLPKNPFNSQWRISSDLVNGRYPDILEFGPKYKGQPLDILQKNQSIHIIDEDNPHIYPGFCEGSTNDKYVPCCFVKPNRNINKVFGLEDSSLETNENYILGDKKNLDEDRIGILKKPFPDNFFNEENKCLPGPTINEKISCYLRQGIKISHNSFFSLLASYKVPKETDIHVINYMIKNITEKNFKNFNNGNLELLFRDNLAGYPYNISSLQNYLEYILSDENKDHKFFIDFLTRPNSYCSQKGLILIILEEKNKKFNILCPYFMNIDWYNDPNVDIAIALKIGTMYQPIFLYDKSKIPKKTFKKNTNTIINYLLELLVQNCKINLNPLLNKETQDKSYDFDEIKQKLNSQKKYIISKYLTDDYNKIVAIYLTNKLIIPCKPFINTEDEENYIDINSIIDKLELLNPFDLYIKLNEFYNDTGLKILVIRKIIDNKENISGLELSSGHIIPVNKKINIKESDQYYNNLETFKGYHNFDTKLIEYQKFINDKFFMKKNNIIDFLKIINTKYLTLDISINKLYVKHNKLLGLILNDILVEIEPIDVKDIPNILIKHNDTEIELKSIKRTESDVFVSDYEKALNQYFDLWKKSNYLINVKPIKNIVNNKKKIIGFILEQGQIVRLNYENYKLIYDRNSNNEYLLNSITDADFYTRIDEIKPNLYESIYLDNRIKFMKKLNYKNNIYKLIKLRISESIKNNQKIKEYLNKIFLSKTYTLKYKKIYTEYLIKILFSINAHHKQITEEDFYKKNLNFKLNCNELDDKKNCDNNDLCTYNPIQLEDNIEKTKQDIFIEMWKKIYKESQIVYDNDLLELYFKEKKMHFSENNEDNIIKFYNYIYAEKKKMIQRISLL